HLRHLHSFPTRRSSDLEKNYTIVIHGKPQHEETRATFSHSKENAPTVIVRDLAKTQLLARYITGELPASQFFEDFRGLHSEGFRSEEHTSELQSRENLV